MKLLVKLQGVCQKSEKKNVQKIDKWSLVEMVLLENSRTVCMHKKRMTWYLDFPLFGGA